MKYRKKPVVIDAVQYSGSNICEIEEFVGKELRQTIVDDYGYQAGATAPLVGLIIETLEGDMIASPCDYIIKGVKGEFYPCKPDVFEQTYEKADKELLTIERKTVVGLYEKFKQDGSPSCLASAALLDTLFGAKCQ